MIGGNVFKPENQLEKSLVNASKNPSSRPQFYRDLLEADILVINRGKENLKIKNNLLEKGSKLEIPNIERNGKLWIPIFSSLTRLRELIPSEVVYVKLNARDFFENARGSEIILNPASEFGKEFSSEEVEKILDNSIFKPYQTIIAKKETKLIIGQPAVFPEKLVKELIKYFSTNKNIIRAYLVQIYNPESSEPPHLLVSIDARGDFEKIIGDVGLIATGVLGKDEFIDFTRLNNSDVSQGIFNSTKPFYQASFIKSLLG